MKRTTVLCYLIILARALSRAQKPNGLNITPPMGWKSWYDIDTDHSEKPMHDIANAFADPGRRETGYTCIAQEDGWMAKERDAEGHHAADLVKFPNGMKTVAAYVHSRGLRFRLWCCAGWKKCTGFRGGRSHENFRMADRLWHQFEGITVKSYGYELTQHTLIQSWRNVWGYGFPFCYLQYESTAGMVVSNDNDNPDVTYPLKKIEVSESVAHRVSQKAKGKTEIKCQDMTIEKIHQQKNEVRIFLCHAGGTLISKKIIFWGFCNGWEK